jgi:O-antigen/teichoic acid export membrane protein
VAGAVTTTLASFLVAFLVSQESRGFAGAFFTSTAVATIGGNSLALGTPTSLVYFMPQALAGNRPAPRGLIVQTLRPVVVASCLVGVAVALLAPLFAELVSDQRVSEITTLIRAFAPAIPAWAITAALLGATRGLGSMTPTVVVSQVLRPGGQIIFLGTLYLIGSPSALAVGLAWMLPVVIAMVAAVMAVARLGGFHGPAASAISSTEFWSYARPRAIANALQIALERIDVIFVQALLGADAAGVYGALTRYIAAGNFLIFAVAQAVSVSLRRAIATENLRQAGQILRQTTTWLMLAAWPYFLIVALKPDPLANILNGAFVADAGILSILAVGMMVSAAAGPIDLTLLMLGKSKLSLAGIGIAISTDIALLLVLAPRYGLAGAASAWAISVVAQNLFASYLVRRTSGLTTPSAGWLRAAVLTVGATVPVGLVTGNDFGGLMITGAVAGTLLLIGLYFSREVLGLGAALNGRPDPAS